MNRQIRWVGAGIMALFVVLFVQLNYLQVVHAPALQHNSLNGEQVVKEYNLPRGAIISSDGVTLADSTPAPSSSSFKYARHYPTGALFAQVTGYYSFIYGSDGVEKTYDSVLVGTKHRFKVPTNLNDLGKLLTNSPTAQNVTLTLSDKLQKLAQSELAGRDGSVVALDPSTGAILAMYSNPTYNPESLSQLSTVKETAAWKRLLAAQGNPLSPGAYRNRWFPGSTFKVITASAVYDHQPALATKSYPSLNALHLPDTTNELHNFGQETCGGMLPELLTVSCDTGFGAVGLDLGAAKLSREAKAFGFDQTPPIDLPDPAQSYFPPTSSFVQNRPTLAYSAIGQEDVQATPLEMAMVAGAIADKGRMMSPHVLDKVTNAQNAVVSTYHPKLWQQATSAATAAQMTTLMESVVSSPDGTGTEAAIPGVAVAAKTGTAQTGTNLTDDWMIAFAASPHPSIAVAVLLPDQPAADEFQGGTVAAPIAKAMIEAYLSDHPSAGTAPSASTTTVPTSHTTTTTPPTAPTSSTPTSTRVTTSTTPTTPATAATTPPATTATTPPATSSPTSTPSPPTTKGH
jgi:peptidoglycan glycosyltransferase